jgi:hypothetical protein
MKQTQSQNKLNSSKTSPLKRQRSDSPTKESDMAADLARSSTTKKRKSEEPDLVVIEGPSTPTKVGHPHQFYDNALHSLYQVQCDPVDVSKVCVQ